MCPAPKAQGKKGKVVGLTGNIGCGKSTAARFLIELGIPVVDADQIAREVVQPGKPAYQKVLTAFGQGILDTDGTINRSRLRELVFQNASKRKELESILHPVIRKRSFEIIGELLDLGHHLVIYEAPLLVEAGHDKKLAGILMIRCSEENQLKRLLQRDRSLSADMARAMIASQMPQDLKAKHCTWVIANDESEDSLRSQLQTWLRNYK